uniref:Uncharacterized protein n=1 Tax=Haptolina ericina TaxID=156174 RepID=A0A7S3BF68_9EUKA
MLHQRRRKALVRQRANEISQFERALMAKSEYRKAKRKNTPVTKAELAKWVGAMNGMEFTRENAPEICTRNDALEGRGVRGAADKLKGLLGGSRNRVAVDPDVEAGEGISPGAGVAGGAPVASTAAGYEAPAPAPASADNLPAGVAPEQPPLAQSSTVSLSGIGPSTATSASSLEAEEPPAAEPTIDEGTTEMEMEMPAQPLPPVEVSAGAETATSSVTS